MKKIIVINDFDYIQGGASNVALEMASILFDSGLDVTFFSGVTNGESAKFKKISLNDKDVANGQSVFRNIKNKKAYKVLLNMISKEHEYDIFVHGWTKCLSSEIFKIGKLSNVRLFVTWHDYFSVCPNGGLFNYKKCKICDKKPMGFKCAFTNCDSRNYLVKLLRVTRTFYQNKIVNIKKYLTGIIYISEFNQSILSKYFSGIPAFRINNPVRNLCTGTSIRPELNNEYLYIGRLDQEKGVQIACEAALVSGIKLNVIGDGQMLEKLKIKYKGYHNISFIGWLDRNDMIQYIKKTRCLIFPSLWYEGAGLTTIEVMAFGIPCIVSSNTAAIDYVSNNNGFIFEQGSVSDLVKAIKESKNGDKIKNMSKECIKIYENFTIEKYKKKIMTIINSNN